MVTLRNQWRSEMNADRKKALANNIINFASEIQDIYTQLKKAIEQVPLMIMEENVKKTKINDLNGKIREINTIFAGEIKNAFEQRAIEEKEIGEKGG